MSSYKKHDAEFRYQVAKEALASGVRPTGKKYGISESTIRGFIKSLKEHEVAHPQVTMESLPQRALCCLQKLMKKLLI